MPRLQLNAVTRIVLIYLLVSALWVIFSDRILEIVAASDEQVNELQTFKGLLFILLSGAVIYGLLAQESSRRQQVEDELRDLNARLEERINAATEELKTANKQLSELNTAQRSMIRDVSHALRTPLTTLSMRLDLIDRVDPARIPEYLPGLRQQMNILNDMVTGMLDLSRIEEAHAEGFQPVNLNHTLERVVEAHVGYAQDRNLALDFATASDLPTVQGHDYQLNLLFSNIIGNAVKYTEEGHVSVQCHHDTEGRQAVVQISDTGCGIEPGEIPKLFDRFYRTQGAKNSSVPGTGLGLGIVREIIDRHNGEITVDSTPGKGSTFTVYLPLTQPGDTSGQPSEALGA